MKSENLQDKQARAILWNYPKGVKLVDERFGEINKSYFHEMSAELELGTDYKDIHKSFLKGLIFVPYSFYKMITNIYKGLNIKYNKKNGRK